MLIKNIFINSISKNISEVKFLQLQTYFGDVRDCYSEICNLDFDGVGLDFVEGKQSLTLVKKSGFPADKILFAGVVNGKNIWKNHYANTLYTIAELQKYCNEIVLTAFPL